ncbi:MAG TPA: aminotransferase class V-fold PLP-dependent enzyme [Thermoanaerobaculia bacterium]|nr:aminotransferase class V-fold PLP-dependent enzyme [Thermoanaerobaculia bacterium]
MFDFSSANLDREFPVRKNLVYLNHAAVAPLPARVAAAVRAHADDQSNFGALRWKTWYRRYDELREKAAAFVGGDASRLSLLPSTSLALNLVAQGLDWKTGDNVVGDDLEFPANVYPWMNLAPRGVEYRIARSRDGRLTAGDFAPLVDERTRVVAVSWVAFHSGAVLPIADLAALCRDRPTLLVVDAIQGLGTMPIDAGRLGIDVLAADGHKFLYGPEGLAIFAFSEKAKAAVRPPWVGWWNVPWQDSQLAYELRIFESGRRFEAGSLPTGSVFALAEAIDLLSSIGMEEAQSHIGRLTGALRDGLASLGWTFRTPEGSRSAILAAVPPSGDARAAVAKLEERKIVTSPREGAVRFAPHVGNDETEIERVLEAARAID